MKMQIYLAGSMGNLTFEESDKWRRKLKEELLQRSDEIKIINPNDYFNFQQKQHETEAEVRNFDLRLVRQSGLIVVNFNDPTSIGTAQELAVANELRIPVIGINESNYNLHPWLSVCCERIFVNIEQVLEYLTDFYLN